MKGEQKQCKIVYQKLFVLTGVRNIKINVMRPAIVKRLCPPVKTDSVKRHNFADAVS